MKDPPVNFILATYHLWHSLLYIEAPQHLINNHQCFELLERLLSLAKVNNVTEFQAQCDGILKIYSCFISSATSAQLGHIHSGWGPISAQLKLH